MQQFVQLALLVVALIVGAYLLFSEPRPAPQNLGGPVTAVSIESPAERMLQFIESEIADQEDLKDVRCWSSVNKIQTFLSGLPVELEANGQRVERYVELIEEIWIDANDLTRGQEIDAEVLQKILESRFPENVSVSSGKAKFDFGRQFASIEILEEAIEDYSDTIESWRLLQSWALRKASQKPNRETGKQRAAFTPDSLKQFRDFLVAFDVALLKSAKDVAMERKLASIDFETINIAFDRSQSGLSAAQQKDN